MIVVLDLETTGLDPTSDAVVEIAAVPLTRHAFADMYLGERSDIEWRVGPGASSLVAPGRRIPSAARAVHHIGNDVLRTAPHLRNALRGVMNDVIQGHFRGTVACHHADFDKGFVGKFFLSETKWLCTWRVSQHLYPDADSHGNQALRYYLPGVDDAFNRWQLGMPEVGTDSMLPHRALYDAGVTAHILRHMLATNSLEDLLVLQNQPVLQRVVRFGKHRGMPWTDVPRDYCNWILRADPPFDSDVRHTARYWLNN